MGVSEAATGVVLYKKVFLEISQNLPENFCTHVFFLWILQNFLELLFLQNTSGGCFWSYVLVTNVNTNLDIILRTLYIHYVISVPSLKQ